MNLEFPKRDIVVFEETQQHININFDIPSRAAETSYMQGSLSASIAKKRNLDNSTSSQKGAFNRFVRSKSQEQWKIMRGSVVSNERSKYLLDTVQK